MDLQMKPIEWDGGEAYELHAEVRSGRESIKIGHAWRAAGAGDKWLIAPGETFDPASPDAERFKAATVDDAKAFIGQRTRVLEIPRNRLAHDTAYDLTVGACMSIQEVAKKSDSVPGYIAGLATAMARALHEHVKDDKHTEVVTHLSNDIAANLERLKTATGMAEGLAKALMSALERRSGDDDDEAPRPATH